MKNPQQRQDHNSWIEQLKLAGFAVADRGSDRVLIGKYGCGAVLERTAAGEPRFAVRPGLLTGDEIARLVDRGFQKFWQLGERQFPALSDQLKALYRFETDLRAVMGLTSLYNQSLGTVSARYVYDRVEGREEPKRHLPFD